MWHGKIESSMTGEKPYKPRSLTYSKNLPDGARARLRELILYVSEKCEKADRFGMIKLNKIIWRADFRAFQARRSPITGATYHKLRLGPAPVDMRPVLEEMRRKREIEIESIDFTISKSEKRVVAVLPANLTYFNAEDRKFIDEAIEYYWNKTGMEASDESHGVAWRTRAERQKIPYEAVFLNDAPLSSAGKAKFARMAQEKKWVSR